MKRWKTKKQKKGFGILMSIWILLLLSTLISLLAHFMGERQRFMREAKISEQQLDQLHRHNFRGKKLWSMTFDTGQSKSEAVKNPVKHKIFIQFGDH